MDLIADTNVWYNIGFGERDPKILKDGDNRLIATPTSILEIASLIDDRNLSARKLAAQAILDHADMIIENSEYHLTQLWQLDFEEPNIPWREAVSAIAQANSIVDLHNGIPDFNARVVRKVDVQLAKNWRIYHWEDFKNQVETVLNQHIPGYIAARSKGKAQFMNQTCADVFAKVIKSPDFRKILYIGTFLRALLVAGQDQRDPTSDEYNHVEPLLRPYIDAYSEYIIKCATEYVPKSNDLGDLECFIYLQADAAFLSSDKRWVNIAREVCPENFYDIEK